MKIEIELRVEKAGELFRKGNSHEEIATKMGIDVKTVKKYLINYQGFKHDSIDNVNACGRLSESGMSNRDISKYLNLKLHLVTKFILEYERNKTEKCDRCGSNDILEKHNGFRLCPKCILGKDYNDEVTLDYSIAWKSVENGGSFQ